MSTKTLTVRDCNMPPDVEICITCEIVSDSVIATISVPEGSTVSIYSEIPVVQELASNTQSGLVKSAEHVRTSCGQEATPCAHESCAGDSERNRTRRAPSTRRCRWTEVPQNIPLGRVDSGRSASGSGSGAAGKDTVYTIGAATNINGFMSSDDYAIPYSHPNFLCTDMVSENRTGPVLTHYVDTRTSQVYCDNSSCVCDFEELPVMPPRPYSYQDTDSPKHHSGIYKQWTDIRWCSQPDICSTTYPFPHCINAGRCSVCGVLNQAACDANPKGQAPLKDRPRCSHPGPTASDRHHPDDSGTVSNQSRPAPYPCHNQPITPMNQQSPERFELMPTSLSHHGKLEENDRNENSLTINKLKLKTSLNRGKAVHPKNHGRSGFRFMRSSARQKIAAAIRARHGSAIVTETVLAMNRNRRLETQLKIDEANLLWKTEAIKGSSWSVADKPSGRVTFARTATLRVVFDERFSLVTRLLKFVQNLPCFKHSEHAQEEAEPMIKEYQLQT